MLLIILLGLIIKLALLCDGCVVGTSAVNNLDFTRVGIIV